MVIHAEYEEQHISEPRINDRIRVPEVRLVGPNGEQVGIVRVEDALRLADEADLDLVEVAPDARPPVCKLMDFGKFKYESDMKAREARRNQTNTLLKEIRFRLKIDPHDYATKKGHVERFLRAGDKVKVMIMFRGREQSRPEMGMRLLQRLAQDVTELGFVESTPRLDGRNMIMVIGPHKKKAEAKNEQRRKAREAEPAGAKTSEPSAEDAGETPAAVETADAVQSVAAVEAPAEVTPEPAAEPVVEEAAPVAEVAAPVAPTPAKAAPAKAAPAKVAAAKAAPTKATPAKTAPAKAAPAPAAAAPADAAPADAPGPAVAEAPAAKVAAKPGAPKPGAPKPGAPKPAARTAKAAPAKAAPAKSAPEAGADT